MQFRAKIIKHSIKTRSSLPNYEFNEVVEEWIQKSHQEPTSREYMKDVVWMDTLSIKREENKEEANKHFLYFKLELNPLCPDVLQNNIVH